MYAEYVTIYVDGKKVVVLTPCNPNTPKEELKKKAIDVYVHDIKNRLITQNCL